MSRHDAERLQDILAAIDAIHAHLRRGDLADGLVFDAVRVRLIEIGEAVKRIGPELLTSEVEIPWAAVASMRDHLAHQYFDTSHAVVAATVAEDLPSLEQAVRRLIGSTGGPLPRR
ncbi:MAG TPA: HepT-like ribonuclease domain-containing protein [Candidatus Dormibacteraeota bacterium]|nr:HepT-like ribonuclease domain-containing protein [Candidatus Dormibacteraeota bacterium]